MTVVSHRWAARIRALADIVAARRSCRAFTDQPVEDERLHTLLQAALRAPSGGNLQPWHFYLLDPAATAALKLQMQQVIGTRPEGDMPDYEIYPPNLKEPYRSRRYRVGEALYGALGIARENKLGRLAWLAQNYQFFGAPVGLFCFVDRTMGSPQWSDLGMILQTLMLLAEEAGLATCAQEAWSRYGKTVARFVDAPADLMLFCGMAIGYADSEAAANQMRAERAPLDDVLTICRR